VFSRRPEVPPVVEVCHLREEAFAFGAFDGGENLYEVGTEIVFDEGRVFETVEGVVPVEHQTFGLRQIAVAGGGGAGVECWRERQQRRKKAWLVDHAMTQFLSLQASTEIGKQELKLILINFANFVVGMPV